MMHCCSVSPLLRVEPSCCPKAPTRRDRLCALDRRRICMRPGITRFLAAGLLLAGVAVVAAPSAFSQTGDQKPAAPPRGGGPVAELRKAIAGKEKEPAE